MKNIVLFLCTGNYYRSKFAEIYFNFLAKKYDKNWLAISRGFYLENPENVGWISPLALQKLSELGANVSGGNLPQMTKNEDMENARKIIALNETEHRPFIKKHFPEWENRLTYWHIFDKQDVSSEISLRELQKNIEGLISDLS